MRILQTIILSSLLLLIASNAYPQKDKSLQNVFIPEGYALDRNQVQYNQPKDFISYIDSSSKNRHKAQRKAKFYINKCRSASCMQGGLKQASA